MALNLNKVYIFTCSLTWSKYDGILLYFQIKNFSKYLKRLTLIEVLEWVDIVGVVIKTRIIIFHFINTTRKATMSEITDNKKVESQPVNTQNENENEYVCLFV